MTYYYCNQCGSDDSCFPQLYVMLNSEIKYDKHDYHVKFDNKFENKFGEIIKEIAKEKELDARIILRSHIGEVYNRYSRWLLDTQHQSLQPCHKLGTSLAISPLT